MREKKVRNNPIFSKNLRRIKGERIIKESTEENFPGLKKN